MSNPATLHDPAYQHLKAILPREGDDFPSCWFVIGNPAEDLSQILRAKNEIEKWMADAVIVDDRYSPRKYQNQFDFALNDAHSSLVQIWVTYVIEADIMAYSKTTPTMAMLRDWCKVWYSVIELFVPYGCGTTFSTNLQRRVEAELEILAVLPMSELPDWEARLSQLANRAQQYDLDTEVEQINEKIETASKLALLPYLKEIKESVWVLMRSYYNLSQDRIPVPPEPHPPKNEFQARRMLDTVLIWVERNEDHKIDVEQKSKNQLREELTYRHKATKDVDNNTGVPNHQDVDVSESTTSSKAYTTHATFQEEETTPIFVDKHGRSTVPLVDPTYSISLSDPNVMNESPEVSPKPVAFRKDDDINYGDLLAEIELMVRQFYAYWSIKGKSEIEFTAEDRFPCSDHEPHSGVVPFGAFFLESQTEKMSIRLEDGYHQIGGSDWWAEINDFFTWRWTELHNVMNSVRYTLRAPCPSTLNHLGALFNQLLGSYAFVIYDFQTDSDGFMVISEDCEVAPTSLDGLLLDQLLEAAQRLVYPNSISAKVTHPSSTSVLDKVNPQGERANTPQKNLKCLPQNPEVREFMAFVDESLGTDVRLIDLARQFAGNDERKAQSLLAQRRRWKRKLNNKAS